jgi:Tfp pilus assembly protein FimT
METCNRPVSPDGRAGNRGFSIIEMLVVVGIIMAMAAVALPNIGQYIRNYKIRGAANDIATNLQKARNKAIMKNANLGITVVVQDATTYWIHLEDDQTPPRQMMVRQTLDMANASTAAQRVQSTRYRLTGGETVRFATTAAECPNAPGGVPFVPNTYGLRFSRLGAFCRPGSSATCPDVTIAPGGATLNVVQAAGGGSLMCITEPVTGLSRWIAITAGGRIAAQQ